MQASESIMKGARNVLYILALAVAWLQGSQEVSLNWSIVAAVGSLGSFITVIVLAFKMGGWTGKFAQKIANLEQEVRTINTNGCGVATRLHASDLRHRRFEDIGEGED